MRAEIRICAAGALRECGENCVEKRIGPFTVYVICSGEDCMGEARKLLDAMHDNILRRLQGVCRGAGGCLEAFVDEGRLCCHTVLSEMPGLASLIQALRKQGVSVEVERGVVTLCADIEEVDTKSLEKSVDRLRNAFLLLESVYDMQRRIAEGVAKGIMLAGGRQGEGGRSGGKRGEGSSRNSRG